MKRKPKRRRTQIQEREQLKNLPSSKATAWVQLCNNRLSDVTIFDSKLEPAKSRLNPEICSAYQRQLKDLAAQLKKLRGAVEAANEGHEDARIISTLASASKEMEQLKAATSQITTSLKVPKASLFVCFSPNSACT